MKGGHTLFVVVAFWTCAAMPVAETLAAPAPECVCDALPSLAARVGRASAAFIGTPITSQADPTDATNGATLFKVQVDEPIKGVLDPLLEIHTPPDLGEDCGARLHLNEQFGIVPEPVDGGFVAGPCDVVSTFELRALLEETLPAPDGVGPVTALVAARAGPAAWVAVDARLRTLGYVASSGDPIDAALCPGGASVLALTPAGLELIDLATLTVRRATPISITTDGARVFCTSPEGDAALFSAGSLVRVDPLGATSELALDNVLDAEAVSLGAYTLAADGVRLVDVDGQPSSTVLALPFGTVGLAMTVTGWDLVVAVATDSALGPGVATRIDRVSLLDGSSSTAMLDTPVPAPDLRPAPGGVVIRSLMVPGETWVDLNGEVLATSEATIWPAGAGFLSWGPPLEDTRAILEGQDAPALAVALPPTLVLGVANGPTLDTALPAAQAMPMVPLRGSVLEPATPSTVEGPPFSVSVITVAPSTTTAPATTEIDDGGGSSITSSAWFGALAVALGALALIAVVVILRRRL